jgi:hypothetical protein
VRAPQRVIPLIFKLAADEVRRTFAPRHLYSYRTTTVQTANALQSVIDWILHAQQADGGIAAYYSFLTGYSASYPEVNTTHALRWLTPRNRMIAEGIELTVEAVRRIDQGTITTVSQAKLENDSLCFVMHDRLKAVAARSLTKSRLHPAAETCDG